MFLLTERYLIQRVAGRWDKQYKIDSEKKLGFTLQREFTLPNGTVYVEPNRIETSNKLHALNTDTASAADVEAIVGNKSWTTQRCNECGLNTLPAMVFDAYECTCTLCLTCVQNAYNTLAAE